MKNLLVIAAALALAAPAAYAQPAGAAAPAQKAEKPAKKDKKAKAAVEEYTPQASEYGKSARCPVSGEEFKVDKGTKAVKYKGKTYYFCCPSCMPAFKKTPAKFAK